MTSRIVISIEKAQRTLDCRNIQTKPLDTRRTPLQHKCTNESSLCKTSKHSHAWQKQALEMSCNYQPWGCVRTRCSGEQFLKSKHMLDV